MACNNKGNLTNISDQEILFLQGSLTDFRVEGNYCYGFVEDNYEKVISCIELDVFCDQGSTL